MIPCATPVNLVHSGGASMTEPRRQRKSKPAQESDSSSRPPKEVPRKRRRASELDAKSGSPQDRPGLARDDSPRRESTRTKANSGASPVPNTTSEQRLAKVEQIIRQIAQLTAQYVEGRSGGA